MIATDIKDAATLLSEELQLEMSATVVELLISLFEIHALPQDRWRGACGEFQRTLADARKKVLDAIAGGDMVNIAKSLTTLEILAKAWGFGFCVLSAEVIKNRREAACSKAPCGIDGDAAFIRDRLSLGMSELKTGMLLSLLDLNARTPESRSAAYAAFQYDLAAAREYVAEAISRGKLGATASSLDMLENLAVTWGFGFCVLSANLLQNRQERGVV